MEILKEEEQGAGAGAIVLGYRMGMLGAGAGALWLASAFTWQQVYTIMGALVAVGMATILLAREPEAGPSLASAEAEEKRIARHLASGRSEEHTSELQSQAYLVCLLSLLKKKTSPHL